MMLKNMVCVSITIPSEAHAKLDISLNSVLFQSIGTKNLKILLLHDSHSDASQLAIAKNYANSYSNVSLCDVGNASIFTNISKHADNCEYFMTLNSGDTLEKHAIETLYYMAHRNALDIVCAKFDYFDTATRNLRYESGDITEHHNISPIEYPEIFLYEASLSGKLISCNLLRSLTLKPDDNASAIEIDILTRSKKISSIPVVIYHKRVYANLDEAQNDSLDSSIILWSKIQKIQSDNLHEIIKVRNGNTIIHDIVQIECAKRSVLHLLQQQFHDIAHPSKLEVLSNLSTIIKKCNLDVLSARLGKNHRMAHDILEQNVDACTFFIESMQKIINVDTKIM